MSVSHSALHFLKVEFNSLSCILIKKICNFYFDVLKNSFSVTLISASANVLSAYFVCLIPVWVVNTSDFNSRAESGAASLLGFF